MIYGNLAVNQEPASPLLTVLSYGIGQDSWTILVRCVEDPEFRQQYAPGTLLVVCAATGDEHKETDEHLIYTMKYCEDHGVPFVHITPDMGLHPKSWQTLNYFYDTMKAVGSKAFPKTCTDNLKLIPIYRYLELYLQDNFDVAHGRKKGFYEFAARYGKVRMLIGIAKGEEKRMSDPSKEPKKWKREAVEIVYPLIDYGMGRKECQDYLRQVGQPVPLPSNCRRCPFMSEQELVWMHRFIPDVYEDWVRQERVKQEANTHKGESNLGVWGKKTLPEVLEKALAKYGHWTDEQLQDYKMSHGHCVASKY